MPWSIPVLKFKLGTPQIKFWTILTFAACHKRVVSQVHEFASAHFVYEAVVTIRISSGIVKPL